MSEEIKHYLQYDMHSAKVSWCPICNAHFYNERNREHTTIATQEHYHTIPAPVKPVEGETDQYFIRQFDSNKYYWCKCENCGWEDSSEFTEGCHAIADTGDHSDPVCPICGCNKLEGDSDIDPDKQYEGIVEVKIPYSIVLSAYKKTIDQLNESLESFRYPSPVNPSLQSGVEDAAKKHALKVWEGQKPNGYIAESIIDFKAGAEWQAKQVKHPVMQWVKSSERMPELYPVNDSSEKHYRLDGYKVDGFFLHSQCFEYFDNGIAGYKQLELSEFNRIEWLEELPIQ